MANHTLDTTTAGFPGAALRARRMERKLSTEAVAAECAIPVSMIDALESGAVERLPTTCYALGFIRSYCRLLQVDSDSYEFALKEARAARSGSPAAPGLSRRLLGRILACMPIPRLRNVPPEVQTWVLIAGVVAGAWMAYSAIIRPAQPPDATSAHAATLDVRLPDELD